MIFNISNFLMVLLHVFIIVVCFVHTSLCSAIDLAARYESALEYYEQGHLLKDLGQVDDALPFFRVANKLIPNNPKFLLFAGISEYNNTHFVNAIKRFQQLSTIISNDCLITPGDISVDINSTTLLNLNVDPYMDISYSNCCLYLTIITTLLHELQTNKALYNLSQITDPFVVLVHHPIYANVTVLPLEVITVSDISSDVIYILPELYLHYNKPFVVRNCSHILFPNATSLFPTDIITNWFPQYLNESVDFYPQNILAPPLKKYTVPLSKAMEYINYPLGVLCYASVCI